MENNFFLFKMGRDILIKNGTDFELKMVKKKIVQNGKEYFNFKWEEIVFFGMGKIYYNLKCEGAFWILQKNNHPPTRTRPSDYGLDRQNKCCRFLRNDY